MNSLYEQTLFKKTSYSTRTINEHLLNSPLPKHTLFRLRSASWKGSIYIQNKALKQYVLHSSNLENAEVKQSEEGKDWAGVSSPEALSDDWMQPPVSKIEEPDASGFALLGAVILLLSVAAWQVMKALGPPRRMVAAARTQPESSLMHNQQPRTVEGSFTPASVSASTEIAKSRSALPAKQLYNFDQHNEAEVKLHGQHAESVSSIELPQADQTREGFLEDAAYEANRDSSSFGYVSKQPMGDTHKMERTGPSPSAAEESFGTASIEGSKEAKDDSKTSVSLSVYPDPEHAKSLTPLLQGGSHVDTASTLKSPPLSDTSASQGASTQEELINKLQPSITQSQSKEQHSASYASVQPEVAKVPASSVKQFPASAFQQTSRERGTEVDSAPSTSSAHSILSTSTRDNKSFPPTSTSNQPTREPFVFSRDSSSQTSNSTPQQAQALRHTGQRSEDQRSNVISMPLEVESRSYSSQAALQPPTASPLVIPQVEVPRALDASVLSTLTGRSSLSPTLQQRSVLALRAAAAASEASQRAAAYSAASASAAAKAADAAERAATAAAAAQASYEQNAVTSLANAEARLVRASELVREAEERAATAAAIATAYQDVAQTQAVISEAAAYPSQDIEEDGQPLSALQTLWRKAVIQLRSKFGPVASTEPTVARGTQTVEDQTGVGANAQAGLENATPASVEAAVDARSESETRSERSTGLPSSVRNFFEWLGRPF